MKIVDIKATGRNIERLRKYNGLSVKEMQRHFGFSSPQSIYKWQWGDSLPDLDNLMELAELFEVKVEDIVIRK